MNPRRFLAAAAAVVLALTIGGMPRSAPAQTFATPLNQAASTLAVDHAVGGDALVVKSGEGSRFGSPSPTAPVRVTVARKSTLVGGQIVPTSAWSIYNATARSGDTLSGLTAVEGTSDWAFSRNDPVQVLITAGMIKDLQDAIASIQGGTANAVLTTGSYANPAWIISLAASKLTGTIVATNGVVTTGSYADPAWLTSLGSGKLSGVPAGVLKGSGGALAAAVAGTDYPGLATANAFTQPQTIPTLYGSSAAGGNLQLLSTSNASKGKILVGVNSTYDGVNERLGIGTQSPARKLHLYGTAGPIVARFEYAGAEGTSGTDYTGFEFYSTTTGHIGDCLATGALYPITGNFTPNGIFFQNQVPTGGIGFLSRGADLGVAGPIIFNVGGYSTIYERMRATTTGVGVGVGTSAGNPQTLLQVGAGTDAPAISGAGGTSLYVTNAGATYGSFRDSTNHVDTMLGSNSGGGFIGTRTNQDFVLVANAAVALTVKANGAVAGTLDTVTYAAAISLDVTKGNVHKTTTVDATGAATINASGAGIAGQEITLLIANDATSGKVITFGTNFKSAGTLTGTTSKTATVKFASDGTNWYETSRITGL